MVKHIVFWKLKDEANGNNKVANAQLIKEKLEDLNGKIEGLVKVEVGINFLDSPANYDVALYSEVASKEALDFYTSSMPYGDEWHRFGKYEKSWIKL